MKGKVYVGFPPSMATYGLDLLSQFGLQSTCLRPFPEIVSPHTLGQLGVRLYNFGGGVQNIVFEHSSKAGSDTPSWLVFLATFLHLRVVFWGVK